MGLFSALLEPFRKVFTNSHRKTAPGSADVLASTNTLKMVDFRLGSDRKLVLG